jgi:alpha-N-arabinofuranosidase
MNSPRGGAAFTPLRGRRVATSKDGSCIVHIGQLKRRKRCTLVFQCARALLSLGLFGCIAAPTLVAQETNSNSSAPSEVTVDTSQTGEPISPYIYGQFIEHLGRCIYGGIWAEMLEDRKFYFAVPAPGEIWRETREHARVLAASPWKVLGPQSAVRMESQGAFVGAHSPVIEGAGNGTLVGLYQEGLGLIKGKSYTGYAYIAGDSTATPVSIVLSWGPGEQEKDVVTCKKLGSKYARLPFKFTSRADTENGRLTITSYGKGELRIGCVSLMPADNIEGFRRDTLDLLKQLKAPVYRWPGGNFVSGYDWRDGLGDRDRRPTRTNPAWTGIEPNDVGMDEYIRLCELIGAEPMISVNTGFGDAYSAAAEVEYANGSTETTMGKVRAKNGHPQSYRVKWWCVGNEMFGRWQLGYMQLGHYVLKHNWVEEKMREVDPSIKTVASGEVGPWSRGMLTNCADHMNLISEHFYVSRPNEDVVAHVQQVPQNIKRIADAHRLYRKQIPSLQGKDIRISVDEWNYWYGPHVFGELGTRYFLKDALGIAAGLHEYFRNTDVIFMANYAQTVNVIGCIKTTKTHAEFDPTGLALALYRNHFGTIPVQVANQAAPLDISAALTGDKTALTIGVVNPKSQPVQFKLNFLSSKPVGSAETWTIVGNDPLAFNEPGEPRRVDIQQATPADLPGAVSVQPYSITLWRVRVK